jgi:hypothetical protein
MEKQLLGIERRYQLLMRQVVRCFRLITAQKTTLPWQPLNLISR